MWRNACMCLMKSMMYRSRDEDLKSEVAAVRAYAID